MTNDPRVIVALDFANAEQALAFAARVRPQSCRLKVGKELFTAAGPALLEKLLQQDFEIFLDLKFHDIPNTVAGACRAAAQLGVWMLNVHALGGRAMLDAARDAVAAARRPPLLIAVTVLTSMGAQDLHEVGIVGEPDAAALRLAKLAQASGLDGVVCSAQEAALLKRECGSDFSLVTPGIRLAGGANDDQQRVMTPATAIRAGADYLVIGRPVTQAADPLAVLESINRDIAALSRP
ncbi:MAG TPA: orotidine-5'-phosphate decarboxylase [Burkholderiales bacterium]|jgi:orotidine-5'-phosphate decarboxylase|nr:orotidine-5'-phosphate decarboxylase [Burkholderiales bacterium]